MAEDNTQPGNLQATLETHKCNRRTTDIPLCCGNPALDKITPLDLTATAQHTYTPFADSKKKPNESVLSFYGRISEQFDTILNQVPALCKDTAQHLQKLIFIAGLPDDLQQEVMRGDSEDKGIGDIYNLALAAEICLEDRKQKHVHPVCEEVVHDQTDNVEAKECKDKAHYETINLLPSSRGYSPRPRPAFFKAQKKAGSLGGENLSNRNGRSIIKCRYQKCGKIGHMQKNCRIRIADGAPCIDQFGQPWRNQPSMQAMSQAKNTSAHLNLLKGWGESPMHNPYRPDQLLKVNRIFKNLRNDFADQIEMKINPLHS